MKKSKIIGWVVIGLLYLLLMKTFQDKSKKEREEFVADSIKNVEKQVTTKKAEIPEETKKEEARGASTQQQNLIQTATVGTDSTKNDSVVKLTIPLRKINVETNQFSARFTSKGAHLESIKIRGLKSESTEKILELIPQEKGGVLSLSLDGKELDAFNWEVSEAKNNVVVESGTYQLVFKAMYKGKELKRIYTFTPDSQSFHHELYPKDLETKFALHWKAGMQETEKIPTGKGLGLTAGFFSEVVMDIGEVERETSEEVETYNEDSGILKWAGLRRKYVAAMIDFGRNTDYSLKTTPLKKTAEESDKMHSYQLKIKGELFDGDALSFDFVVLPLWHSKIKAMNKNYEKIIFTGFNFLGASSWYPKLCGLVLSALNFFHNLIPNYGIAIILLTLLVRSLLLPLTISQTRSMAKMQEHSPAIKKIREKYKGNPQQVQRKTMEYYKEVGVNPLASMTGCLPMFLQFPVFIALFNVLGRAVELKGEPFFLWINDLAMPDVVAEAIKIPYVFPMGLTVLPFFMALTMYFQTKMTMTDPNQKAMVYMMPVMMFMFSSSFPSGLVVYWTVSNVFTIAQTKLLKKNKPAIAVAGVGNKPSFQISEKKKPKKQ